MIVLNRGFRLPRSSRAAVGRVNLAPERGIMGGCKRPFLAGRRRNRGRRRRPLFFFFAPLFFPRFPAY